MNYKTIRAYQFKADQAVAALEATGAVWATGQGKPHWAMPIVPTVDVEAIKKEALREFLAEIAAIGAPKPSTNLFGGAVPDLFEMGTQHFHDREKYIGRKAMLNRIPSWHGMFFRKDLFVGGLYTIEDISYRTKSNYKGYTVSCRVGGQMAWFPLGCVTFK